MFNVTVQDVFYSTTMVAPIVRGNFSVDPNQWYFVRIEVMRGDTDQAHEKVSSITINGDNVGSCNPSGSGDCTFFDCPFENQTNQADHLKVTSIRSVGELIDIELSYSSQVDIDMSCYCDYLTGTCGKRQYFPSGAPIVHTFAAARVTLIPHPQGK